MKKGINKKALILPLFILTILAVNIILISAADSSIASFFTSASDWFKRVAYPDILNETPGGIFVAVIGVILILVIIGDLLSLASPLSDWVNWVIAVGVTLILLTMGTARVIIGWVMLLVTSIFGVGGGIALVMTAVVFLVLVIFLFFGGLTLQKWLTEIKGRRQMMDAQKQAYKNAAAMVKGAKTFKEAGANI